MRLLLLFLLRVSLLPLLTPSLLFTPSLSSPLLLPLLLLLLLLPFLLFLLRLRRRSRSRLCQF
jgi:hypothetical protein